MRPRIFTHDFAVSDAGTGVSPAKYVGNVRDLRLQVSGTFSATLQVQESVDGSTGWTAVGADVTSAGMVDLSAARYAYLRIETTVYASGTPEADLFGVEEHPDDVDSFDLPAPEAVAAGAAREVGHLDHKMRVGVTITGTATVQVQESVDGSTWVNVGAAFTASGVREVAKRTRMVRCNVTAHSSGTNTATVWGVRSPRQHAPGGDF